MNKYSIFLFLLFFVFVSCKKEKADEEISAIADPEFTTCNCSIAEPGKPMQDEYIKVNINGVAVCADIKRNFQGSFQDSFDNMFIYGTIKRSTGDTYYDNLHMIRSTKDGKFMMAIFMENTHLLTKQFPYQLPRTNPEFCEIGTFQFKNQLKMTSNMCSFCPDDNWNYSGAFSQSQLKLTAVQFDNSFFEGYFEGLIHTGSGRYATVKDGKFRIRLTMIQRDIIIP
jgi:hypothetical protein